MTSLILTWLPVVCVAGFGGRLLDHRRGYGFGALCALFWVMLLLGSFGSLTNVNASTLVALLGGAAAIVVIGRWSRSNEVHAGVREPQEVLERKINQQSDEALIWSQLSEELFRFDGWLDDRRGRGDVWDEFDEYVRSALARLCHATHVRPYRAINHATGLEPLRVPDVWDDVPAVSSTEGIPAQVMHGKSRYMKSSSVSSGDSEVDADSRTNGATWCFPVLRNGVCLGVIEVATTDVPDTEREKVLTCIERMIGLFWNAVYDSSAGAHLSLTDPVSGLLTREAFIQSAQHVLKQAHGDKEPVAMVIIAVEGLRQLSDSGHWESVDETIRSVSDIVRKKIRTDDCLGRFDESRIVMLLRRVDSELATLVATQLATRLEEEVGDSKRRGGAIEVRCSVVASGFQPIDIRTLLFRALSTGRHARIDGVSVVSSAVELDIAAGAAI